MAVGTYRGSYSSRPTWQWVIIYLIIGGIIYGLIYFFFLNKGYRGIRIPSPTQNIQQQGTPGSQTPNMPQNNAPQQNPGNPVVTY